MYAGVSLFVGECDVFGACRVADSDRVWSPVVSRSACVVGDVGVRSVCLVRFAGVVCTGNREQGTGNRPKGRQGE